MVGKKQRVSDFAQSDLFALDGIAGKLFEQTGEAAAYRPISSVWEGSYAELLEIMLSFYPPTAPEPILDATYNSRGSGGVQRDGLSRWTLTRDTSR